MQEGEQLLQILFTLNKIKRGEPKQSASKQLFQQALENLQIQAALCSLFRKHNNAFTDRLVYDPLTLNDFHLSQRPESRLKFTQAYRMTNNSPERSYHSFSDASDNDGNGYNFRSNYILHI